MAIPQDAGPKKAWYHEPLMWLVVAIPLITVVGGLTTVVIAHRNADPVVADEYRKEGLAINRDPTRDNAAARFGVSAAVTLTGRTLTVRLDRGTAEAPAELAVLLSHVTRAELDQLVTLRPDANGAFAGELSALPPGRWRIEISPGNRSWRLAGEFVDAPGALVLRPASVP